MQASQAHVKTMDFKYTFRNYFRQYKTANTHFFLPVLQSFARKQAVFIPQQTNQKSSPRFFT